jgi:hypothetical protein
MVRSLQVCVIRYNAEIIAFFTRSSVASTSAEGTEIPFNYEDYKESYGAPRAQEPCRP